MAGVAMIAGTVWFAGQVERSASRAADSEVEAGQTMLTSMLDRDSAVRSYVLTRHGDDLARYDAASQRFETAAATARESALGYSGDEKRQVATQERLAREWKLTAERAIRARPDDVGPHVTPSAPLLDRFRAANAAYLHARREEQATNDRHATLTSILLIVGVGLILGGAGYLLVERRIRHRDRRRDQQDGFAEAMQLARSEGEAYGVLERHVERTIENSNAVVLVRNNSADRLEARTPVEPESPIFTGLENAAPESCLAVRSARTHKRDAGERQLLTCEVCGMSSRSTTCVPSLVGGEVVGSVLVEHDGRLSRGDEEQLRATVAESGPAVSNLRTLAIAELRAATDGLTGLPNNRSVHETLKRMVAEAGRRVSPLAAVVLDLDHFKNVNDTFGHERGDEVLAAVGAALRDSVRESDFAGRQGGEEFIVLLPDTGREGAIVAAEKLRATVAAIEVPGVPRSITASLGVAIFPDEARDAPQLLRTADRALYTAKANGRDRVETAVGQAAPVSP